MEKSEEFIATEKEQDRGTKKVGIVTFHYADNYGAVLQCYALYKVINSMPGYKAYINDFVPYHYQYPKQWNTTWQKLKYEKKRIKFRDFMHQNCGIDIKHTSSQITGEDYDILCVGSDQVWNVKMSDKEFFLPNVRPGVKKISYAASIGASLQKDSLDEKLLRNYVTEFSAISVREKEHVDIVERICKKNCTCVLDPTLLLESQEYEHLVSSKREKTAPILFFFWLRHDGEMMRGVELANNVARKYNLRIVHSIVDAYKDMFYQDAGMMFYDGVEDFLWYLKNADFIITNSYHATIFAVLFETPFYVYNVESMKSRIETLNQHMGIESRIVKKYIPMKDIDRDFDFKAAKASISRLKEQSKNYLLNALEDKV